MLELHGKKILSDYITAITRSPDGKNFAVCSAAGEVMLGNVAAINKCPAAIANATGHSINCLAFSRHSQFPAAGGQDGKVRIWRVNSGELIAGLDNERVWVYS